MWIILILLIKKSHLQVAKIIIEKDNSVFLFIFRNQLRLK